MLRRNIIANYFGQIWVAIMGLAFVPVYIRYLGIDAYGLIGIYSVLQACLTLLDVGMTPMLSREMARFTGGGHTNQSIRDLLRSVELIACTVALVMALGVIISANWLARSWIRSDALEPSVVSQAFMLMGLVVALRFVEGIYRSAIIGLQRHVLFNVINSVTMTFRWGGAAFVLAFVSSTVTAFFVWQACISLATVLWLWGATYKNLPEGEHSAQASIDVIKNARKFAGGMFLISITVLILTNLDKIILSTSVPLSDYGYYTLTVTAVGGLTYLSSPIIQAMLPKLAELHENGNSDQFSDIYHTAAQMVSIVLGSASWLVIFFSDTLLELWTNNLSLVQQTSYLLKLMAFGTLLNGMMGVPYIAQLAIGWTRLTIITNIVSILILIPALLVLVSKYGVYGAAIVWIALNSGYLTISAHFIYKKILPGEKAKWYLDDVIYPLVASLIGVIVVKTFYPDGSSAFVSVLYLTVAIVFGACLSALAASKARASFFKIIGRNFGWQ